MQRERRRRCRNRLQISSPRCQVQTSLSNRRSVYSLRGNLLRIMRHSTRNGCRANIQGSDRCHCLRLMPKMYGRIMIRQIVNCLNRSEMK